MRNKWSILIIFLFLSSLFLIFDTTNAQQVKDPGASKAESFCFTKKECFSRREEQEATEPKKESAFYTGSDTDICNPLEEDKEMGFCLPAGQASTQVEFAGTDQFANVGEFIQFIYKWSMTAGAILAVLVILISGIQWTISMGNQSVIKKAKSRIAGAIAGIALLASSYLILNTINPALVNMRLPQTWMVKGQKAPNPEIGGEEGAECNPNKKDSCKGDNLRCAPVARDWDDYSQCAQIGATQIIGGIAVAAGTISATAIGGSAAEAGAAKEIASAAGTQGVRVLKGAGKMFKGAAKSPVKSAASAYIVGGVVIPTVKSELNQNGVCVKHYQDRSEGDFCVPNQDMCAGNMKCIKPKSTGDMFSECILGAANEYGFCSKGDVDSPCKGDDDCFANSELKCKTIDNPIAYEFLPGAGTQRRTICTAGKKGHSCNDDRDCQDNLTCSSGFECVSTTTLSVGEKCENDDECGSYDPGFFYTAKNMACYNENDNGNIVTIRDTNFVEGYCLPYSRVDYNLYFSEEKNKRIINEN